MTAKKKRRRNRASTEGTTETASSEVVEKEEAPPERPPRPMMAESPFPPLGQSLAQGLRVVGSSPPILAVAFLSLLATWGVFVALGAEPSPRTLAVLLSAPPVHVFSDAPIAIPRGASATFSVAAVAGLAALRGITFGLLSLLIVDALRSGSASLGAALRALPRIALVFTGLYLIQFGLVLAAFQLLVGLLGQLAFLAIAAGLYFLVFSPIVAAAEGQGPAPAVRRGARAARLPGARHLTMVMAYFLVLFYSGAVAPFPVLGPATPSVGAWAYGLFSTFIHVSVLAAFAYRWLAVRDQVPAVAPRRKR